MPTLLLLLASGAPVDSSFMGIEHLWQVVITLCGLVGTGLLAVAVWFLRDFVKRMEKRMDRFDEKHEELRADHTGLRERVLVIENTHKISPA